MKLFFQLFLLMLSLNMHSQSDIEKVLKGGEIIVNGLSFFKSNTTASQPADLKVIESVCVKNKLTDKITFKIAGKDENDNEVKKELVIQKDGKECIFALQKGIYTYEIVLSNKEIYKKGEYRFNEAITITIKEE